MDAVLWSRRDVAEHNEFGDVLFERRNAEVPEGWSQNAAVEALRDLAGAAKDGTNAVSLRELMEERFAELHAGSLRLGYFARAEDAHSFTEELAAMELARCLVRPRPRQWAASEAQRERTGGQVPSGTARWLSLDDPELANLLAGRQRPGAGDDAWQVAIPDELMAAAEGRGAWPTDGAEPPRSGARELLDCIADAVWTTGAPALVFADRQRGDARQADGGEGATPALRDTPFRATIHLSRFVTPLGELDLPLLAHAVRVTATALEIELALHATGIDEEAAQLRTERPIAIAVAGFSALAMESGVAYDSPLSRSLGAALAALVCGEAMLQSARIAESCPPVDDGPPAADGTPGQRTATQSAGACLGFRSDPERSLEQVRQQQTAAHRLASSVEVPARQGVIPIRGDTTQAATATSGALAWQLPTLVEAARSTWDAVLAHAESSGFRNLRVTAPASEAGGSRTTDVESGFDPQTTLLTIDRRASSGARGGRAKPAVRAALFRMGYSQAEAEAIVASLESSGTMEGAPFLRAGDRMVFACAAAERSPEERTVSPFAVLRLLAAVQPFVDTTTPMRLRVPESTSKAGIAHLLLEGWRGGLRALAIDRSQRDPASRRVALPLERVTFPFPEASAEQPPAPHSLRGETMSFPLRPAVEPTAEANARRSTDEAYTNESFEPTRPGASLMEETQLLNARTEASLPPTLAEAERQLLERDHAALLETQLHHISELQQQIGALQAAARESADAYDAQEPPRAVRHRLPAERASMTHKFSVAGHEGYITVGLYPDGSPGEIFVRMSKESSAVSGLLDSFATAISLALQHGVPLRVLADHFIETRFEPAGETGNDQIPYARSLMDYLFRWLELRFLSGQQMDLFASLSRPPAQSIPVTGSVYGPRGQVAPKISEVRRPEGSS